MPATTLSSFVTLISGKPRFSGLSRSDLVLWRYLTVERALQDGEF
jgi:hypothetical protein